MTPLFFKLTTLFFLLTCSFLGYAQIGSDTIRSTNPEWADTIVIYEEPVVISSQLEVYRPKVKPAKTKKKSLFFSLNGGVGFITEYNNVCADCIEYTDKVKASTEQLPSYMYNAELSYSKKHWIGAIAIGSYNQQAKFNYTDSNGDSYTSINKIKTIDGMISLGYWIGKVKNKLSVIPSLVFTVANPYEISGTLYTQDATNPLAELQNALDFKPVQYIAGIEAKMLYEVKTNFYITLSPCYNFDIKSIVNNEGPFTIQRNMMNLKLGIMLGLK